jgi:hypothetical protein
MRGLEPPPPEGDSVLSAARLPFRHIRRKSKHLLKSEGVNIEDKLEPGKGKLRPVRLMSYLPSVGKKIPLLYHMCESIYHYLPADGKTSISK